MAGGLMIAVSRALPGREAEFADWYDRNLALICEPEGVLSATRYTMSGSQLPGQDINPNDIVVIYELDDPASALARMMAQQREYNPATDPGSIRGMVVDRATGYVKP